MISRIEFLKLPEDVLNIIFFQLSLEDTMSLTVVNKKLLDGYGQQYLWQKQSGLLAIKMQKRADFINYKYTGTANYILNTCNENKPINVVLFGNQGISESIEKQFGKKVDHFKTGNYYVRYMYVSDDQAKILLSQSQDHKVYAIGVQFKKEFNYYQKYLKEIHFPTYRRKKIILLNTWDDADFVYEFGVNVYGAKPKELSPYKIIHVNYSYNYIPENEYYNQVVQELKNIAHDENQARIEFEKTLKMSKVSKLSVVQQKYPDEQLNKLQEKFAKLTGLSDCTIIKNNKLEVILKSGSINQLQKIYQYLEQFKNMLHISWFKPPGSISVIKCTHINIGKLLTTDLQPMHTKQHKKRLNS